MIRSPSSKPKPLTLRNKRIGRKVLLADRLAHALDTRAPKKTRTDWRVKYLRPKLIAAILAGVFVVGASGFTAISLHASQQAKAQQAEAAKQLAQQKEHAAKADACRRAKAEQKADMIGKITYDELYDNDECDK